MRSCMLRRFEKVVLPLDEGPDMSTIRVPLDSFACAMRSARLAICFSWNASATLIRSPELPPKTLALRLPTVGTPIIRTHIWYSWKTSNILSRCTCRSSFEGSVRSGTAM